MVRACSAPGCKYQHRKGDGLKMHSFPNNIEIRTKWLKAMKKDNCPNYPTKTSLICSQHFQIDCYNAGTLKWNAVPTIFYDSKSIRPVLHTHVVKTQDTYLDPIEAGLREIFDEVESEKSNEYFNEQDEYDITNLSSENECILIEVISDNSCDSLHCMQMQIDSKPNHLSFTESGVEYSGYNTENEEMGYHRNIEDVSAAKRKQPYFIRDFIYEDLDDQVQRKKYWVMTHKVIENQHKKLKYYANQMRVQKERIESLTQKVKHLKAKKQRTNSDKTEKKLIFSIHTQIN